MASKKRGLGRGLDALLGSGSTPNKQKAASEKTSVEGEFRELAVELLQRGRYQPRTDMHQESLQELADSIQEQGLVQPIVVRPVGQDKYEIIAGERRWRAAQIAGLQNVPVLVRDVSDRAAIAMALIENIQRENLNPVEEARSLQRLMHEFELTQQAAAEAVGRSRSGVANLLRLLELNEDVKQLLEQRQLEMGHARALLALKDQAQSEAARKVVKSGMSVRETEQMVRKLSDNKQNNKTKSSSAIEDPDVRHLKEELSAKLGAAVDIQCKVSGKGRLTISFNSNDELEGILSHIR